MDTHTHETLADEAGPSPSRRDILRGATALLATASVPALAATPAKTAPAQAAPPPSYSNLDTVAESDWVVTYAGGRLSISCTVKPKAPSDAVTYLLVAAVDPRDPHLQYCSGSTSLNAMDSAPGTSLNGFASTQLFNPALHGSKVKGLVSGFVKTELGSRSFILTRDFDLPVAPPASVTG
ncbi:hypothetical protein [Archangium lipolyticum]|uniref:hypothetical protein n=1 Tax=Archangium lipolyticum TaxID=2970465 RepID=UPI002149E14F|nr:hypothetical protein [Archangium lipolyticum]